MLKLDDISKICTGIAWGRNVSTLDGGFEINIELPFPFFEALQREMMEMAHSMVQYHKVDFSQPMKFIDIRFPTGILAHIKQSDKNLVFEPVIKELKIVSINPNGGFLKPGGDRA